MFAMDLLSTLSSDLVQPVFNPGPIFPPTTRAKDIANSEHGVDVGFCPVHTCAFETSLDHELVATLDNATADGPALCLEGGILDLLFSFFEIRQVGGKGFRLWELLLEFFQFLQKGV